MLEHCCRTAGLLPARLGGPTVQFGHWGSEELTEEADVHTSEKKLESELDGPSRAFLVRDRAERRAGRVRGRIHEHHMIHGVNGFGPELERLGFRDSGVLEHRQVELV